ncbi:hypothetical protein C2I18_11535 [Paenibacillus sp. PK3_47]|uniref:sigma-70 family RNA polymerase sigma factor n=1 Tax=Paenibacillus sp. PK3_47 TaxID=2072642 RepID=UPI00201D5510|nr:sigma-70 family RNA polymerase sigma factor [Paenibacillus sp. PK3_47]UQZ34103.1 hypothetical protein C2I18_11535 [Paenibacillus sp. PK3_47]
MKETDWTPLLIRMSQGDEDAFHTVYESTRDHAYRLIRYLAPSQQDAADIVSEVYVELFRSLHSYDPGKNFAAWFNGLIVRQVRNWKRKALRTYQTVHQNKKTRQKLPG